MKAHSKKDNKSDEYYTPKYIFDSMGDIRFDMDVASPVDRTFCCVPTDVFITERSLEMEWNGFVWMNPPYGKRNSVGEWLDKLADHGNGIGLVTDRTSTPWWQEASSKSDCHLLVRGKIKFVTPNGVTADQPANGTTLFAYGERAVKALINAQENKLGKLFKEFKL